jgi:hypothetical protein
MESAVSAMIKGALGDPVLWAFGAVIGWDHARPMRLTVSFLVIAGSVWGAVRVGVIGLGDTLGFAGAAAVVVISAALMVGLGLAVRKLRHLLAKKWRGSDED